MNTKLSTILLFCLSATTLSSCGDKKPQQHQHVNPDGYPLVLELDYELYYLKNEPDMYYINGSYYYFKDKWYRCRQYKKKCTFPDVHDMPKNIVEYYNRDKKKI